VFARILRVISGSIHHCLGIYRKSQQKGVANGKATSKKKIWQYFLGKKGVVV
jgi:hypothetical protein